MAFVPNIRADRVVGPYVLRNLVITHVSFCQ